MTIGWWAIVVAVMACLFVSPFQALAILLVGALPWVIWKLHNDWANMWVWAVSLPVYVMVVLATGWFILAAESGMQFLLYPMLGLIILFSWPVAAEGM